jgi:hypothetical protein
MHKFALVLATSVAVGLSTAAFAADPAASTSTTSTQNQVPQSQAPAHKMRASHHVSAKKHVVHRRVAHTRHYRNGQGKSVVTHLRAKKTVSTKTAS